MRTIVIFLKAGIVALVAASIVILLPDGVSIPRVLRMAANKGPAAAVKPAEKADTPARPHSRNRRSDSASTESMVTVTTEILNWKTVRFPSAQEVHPGMTAAQLVELYGAPTLRTLQVHEGYLVEQYVYVDRDRNAKTVALLRNGRTVSALGGFNQ